MMAETTTKPVTPVAGGNKPTAQTPSQIAAQIAQGEAQQEFREFKGGVRAAVRDAMAAAIIPPGPIAPAAPSAPPAANEPSDEDKAAAAALLDPDLLYILQQPRGHDGESEKKFCNWVITKINKMGYKPVIMDEGAIFVQVGEDDQSHTLFSCHVDTVHSSSEKTPQKLAYDPSFQHITLDAAPVKTGKGTDPTWQNRRSGSCLGADDGAGVWVLLKMIEAKKPGGYIFHRGEERGCISSHAIARKQEKWLSSWSAAVAFDRPKDFEVITHQGGQECCSIEYARALSEALSADPDDTLKFEPSALGGVTDTRNYRSIVPECVNVAVGYFHHHSADEYLDYGHLVALKDRCIAIDWLKLPITRDPKKYAAYQYGGYHGSSSSGFQGHGSGGSGFPKSQTAAPASSPAASSGAKGKRNEVPVAKFNDTAHTTLEVMYNAAKSVEDVLDWIEMDPELTAKCVLQALIEGRMAQIQYNMLLAKTLKAP